MVVILIHIWYAYTILVLMLAVYMQAQSANQKNQDEGTYVPQI